jgi:hypothetical protein
VLLAVAEMVGGSGGGGGDIWRWWMLLDIRGLWGFRLLASLIGGGLLAGGVRVAEAAGCALAVVTSVDCCVVCWLG